MSFLRGQSLNDFGPLEMAAPNGTLAAHLRQNNVQVSMRPDPQGTLLGNDFPKAMAGLQAAPVQPENRPELRPQPQAATFG